MPTAEAFARIADPTRREHYVYRAFDEQGALLYVGCSHNVEARMADHRHGAAEWFPLMARFTTEGPFNYQTARGREATATHTEGPLYNGFAPANSKRRSASRTFADIYLTALQHGMSHDTAANQASTAILSEVTA